MSDAAAAAASPPSAVPPSPILARLGLSDPFSLDDAALLSVLAPLSQGWHRLGPAAAIGSSPIPLEGLSLLLFRIDDVLRRFVRQQQLRLQEDIEDEAAAAQGGAVAAAGAGSAGGGAEERVRRVRLKNEAELQAKMRADPRYPSIERQRELSTSPAPPPGLVLVVVRFTTLLLSHATHVQANYPSIPSLLALLNADDLFLVTAALHCLLQFQQGSARIFAFSAFTARYGLRIKPYLIAFATGFLGQSRRPRRKEREGGTAWGGLAGTEEAKEAPVSVEEVRGETELVSLSVERGEREMAEEAERATFSFSSTASFKRTSQPSPTLPHPSTPSSSAHPSSLDFPPVLTLPFARSLYAAYLPTFQWPSIPAFVLWLSRLYTISPAQFFPLCHVLRFTWSYSSLSLRRAYVTIRLLTYQLLMSFSAMRKELLHFFMYSSPTLLDDLVVMIREEERVPIDIRAAACASLTQFSRAPDVRRDLRQLGLIQQSVLLACARNAIADVKRYSQAVLVAAVTPPTAPLPASAALDRAAATCAYAESILAFIERLSPRSVYEAPPIPPVELVELMLAIIADPELVHCSLLIKATAVIESVLNSAQSHQVVSKFHAINGVDVCMQRVAAIIGYALHTPTPSSSSSSSLSPAPLPLSPASPLVVAAPSPDAPLSSELRTMVPASYLSVRLVLEKLLVTLITAIRSFRQPVRAQLLSNGQLSGILKQLWTHSAPPKRAASLATPADTSATAAAAPAEEGGSTTKRRRTSRTSSSASELSLSASPTLTSASTSSSAALTSGASEWSWGSEIFSHACTLFCAVVQNNPSTLKQLHTEGVTQTLLDIINTDEAAAQLSSLTCSSSSSSSLSTPSAQALTPPPSASFSSSFLFTAPVLRVIPETLRSICLSHAGLESVAQSSTLRSLFSIFLSSDPAHLDLLDRQLIYFLAKALEELLRHYRTQLLTPAMKELVQTLHALHRQGVQLSEQLRLHCERRMQAEGSKGEEVLGAAPESWVSYTHRLVNVGRFVERLNGMTAQGSPFSAEFHKQGGAAALVSLAELRNRSPPLCGFYDSPPSPAAAAARPIG